MADTNIYCGFPVKIATEAELQAAAMHGSLVHREAGIAFYSYGNAIYCVEDRMKAALETLGEAERIDEGAMRIALAREIQRADGEDRIPDGYANGCDDDGVSDWSLWIADRLSLIIRHYGRANSASPSPSALTEEGVERVWQLSREQLQDLSEKLEWEVGQVEVAGWTKAASLMRFVSKRIASALSPKGGT